MRGVQRSVRQKVVAAAAVAILLAGGAFAAVSATGQSNPRKPANAHRAAHRARARARDLVTAASYLGLSTAALSSELQSGKTLAQIANASSGKSASGLIEALEAAKRAKLAKAAARLPKRVSNEVNRPGGPGGEQRRQAREAKRLAHMHKRITKLVQQRQAAGGAASAG